MHLIFYALSFFTIFAYADPHPGKLKQMVSKALPKKLPYSSAVPFWQYADVDPFFCEQTGYFPDIENCRYYYQCVSFMPGHLIRYVYQCDEDRVYADQDKSCVIPNENERVKCSAKLDKKQDKTPMQTTESNEDIDISLFTEQPFVIDTDNERITKIVTDSMEPDAIEITTVPGSMEPDAIEITTTVTDSTETETETIEITTVPSSTTPEDIGSTQTVQDSTESQTIGITTFPGFTEPEDIGNTTTDYEQSGCVDEGFFGDSENCSKFYRCVKFAFRLIKYEFSCPRGTIWDDGLKTCNFRAAVREINCKDSNKYAVFPFAEQKTVDNSKDQVALVCPTGFRQHPNYCNAFYQCIVNESLEYHLTVFLCPDGSIFDEANIRCSRDQWIRRNSCVNFEIEGKQHSSRILKQSETTMCPAEGRFQCGGSCTSKYLHCKRDQLGTLEGYLFHCPRGQLFSPSEKKCVSSTLSSLYDYY